MKVWGLRVFALVVTAVLLIAGYSAMHPRFREAGKDEVLDVETDLSPTPQVIRSTRAGTPWPMHLYNSVHTSYTTDSGPITDDVLWFNQTGGQTFGSPAVVNGKVFIGAEDGTSNFGYMSCYY